MKNLMIVLMLSVFMLSLSGCSSSGIGNPPLLTNSNLATQTLEKAGYSNIEIVGWDMFGCSEDDFSATQFRATNPVGVQVEGTVCCGFIFKKCTIRY